VGVGGRGVSVCVWAAKGGVSSASTAMGAKLKATATAAVWR